MAAEIGTGKVITDHSTIGLVITTDGSISDIPRDEYAEAEERVIHELSDLNKPFIILLNAREPDSPRVQELRAEMEEKYGHPVTAVSCMNMGEKEITDIMQQILYEFPLREAEIFLPRWILSLKNDHWLRKEVIDRVRDAAAAIHKLRDVRGMTEVLSGCEQIQRAEIDQIDLGEGSAKIRITLQPQLFYQVLSETTGLELKDESELMPRLMELAE